ncbi:MAG: hypothetical protein JWR83_3290 [Aeromicrobium sp.]|nr:hypothetical protein [Aeromicrobium sp.]
MARPVQPLGTFGAIKVKKSGSAYAATTRFRDFDGDYSKVQASGGSRTAAVNALKAKIATRLADQNGGEDLTRQSKLAEAAQLWLEEINGQDRLAQQTIDIYTETVNDVVLPALGSMRLSELTVGTLDRYFKKLAKDHPSRARRSRVVLSQIFALAVRHDALPINPVRATASLSRSHSEVRALSPIELGHVRDLIGRWRTGPDVRGPKPDGQLALIFDVILGTSARIGEALAVRVCDVNLDDDQATITISGTLVFRKGTGLVRQPHPKHSKDWRIVTIPPFAATAVRTRLAELDQAHGEQTIFCTKKRTFFSPANVRRTWRAIRADLGDQLPAGIDLADVSPHTFRKTVATTLDQAKNGGIALAAELLGHHSTEVTEQHYVQATKRINPVTAEILQSLAPDARAVEDVA